MLQAKAAGASVGHRSIFSCMTVRTAEEEDDEGNDPEAPVSTRKVGSAQSCCHTWAWDVEHSD